MGTVRTLLAFLLLAAAAAAQPVVAPSPEPIGPPRGQNAGDYNVVNSFELGYRFHRVGGDIFKYRSDVNFGNGLRLLGGNLTVSSREGHGRFFDTLLLRTQGLGNDPYQFSSLRVEKNRLYRYDLTWRLNDYFNPALAIGGGRHIMSTERRLQDLDFVLLPESRLKLLAGYSRDAQDGPALTTIQLYDSQGDEFPLFSNIRRLQNEYRLGGEAGFLGARFTFLHGWVNFSDRPRYQGVAQPAGADPLDRVTLSQFERSEPYTGSSPYWRLNLLKDARRWRAAARYAYAGSRRNFVFGEFATGTDRFITARSRQTQISGQGRRPVSTGDLALSAFPSESLSITNQTSFYNTRMDGDNSFREVNNAGFAIEFLNFQFLGVRAITNTTDVTYRAAKWFGVYGGYHYSTRRIRSVLAEAFPDLPAVSLRGQQDNRLNAGMLGFRIQPVRPLTVNLDTGIGRADRPFFPTSERNYHLLGARVQYKAKTLLLAAAARSNYNFNSVSLAEHSSRGRNYAVNASWAPRAWVAFDAAYSKTHLDTVSALAYFASEALVTGDRSIYISNIHLGTLMARFGLGSRADFSLGYSRVEDTGDGRRGRYVSKEGGSSLPAFLGAQTFPLTFESPLARFSLKLHQKVRWNAGYQFYRYAERFQALRYGAHTGYTSMLWSF